MHENKTYNFLESYYKNCDEICTCFDDNYFECNLITCKGTYEYSRLYNDDCKEYELVDKNFKAESPNCCPEVTKDQIQKK